MDLTDGLWIASAILHLTALYVSIRRAQIWFRRSALLLWLCFAVLAATGLMWFALVAQASSMLLAMTAWHHRAAWVASGNRFGKKTYK